MTIQILNSGLTLTDGVFDKGNVTDVLGIANRADANFTELYASVATLQASGANAVGGNTTYASLPASSGYPMGTTGYANDAGPVWDNGYTWVKQTYYNVKAFGAVGDGSTHPVSTRYATLGAAQAIYPSATALTQEIDFLAAQRAIEVATAAGGGSVYFPFGTYMMNNATNPNQCLVLPACTFRPHDAGGVQINLLGDGWHNSVLKWPTDYGTDGSDFAISCGDPAATYDNPVGRYASTGMYEGWIQDLMFYGPGASLVIGAKPCNLSGLAWGSRRRVIRCQFYRFYAGINLVGDWSSFYDVYSYYCYYGLYYPRRASSLYGNHQFLKCLFSGNAFASVCLEPGGYQRGTFFGCFLGGAPYSYYLLPGVPPVTQVHIINDFSDCQFEHVGNAFFGDGNKVASLTLQLNIERTNFNGCAFFYNSSNDIVTGGHGTYSMMQCKSIKDVHITSPSDLPEGSECTVEATTISGLTISGNLFMLDNNVHPFLIANSGHNSVLLEDTVGKWRGTVWPTGSTAVALKDCVELVSGNAAPCSTSTTAPVLGVAKGVGASNACVPIATGGHSVDAKGVAGGGSIASQQWVKKSSSGAVEPATGPTDGMVVGWATSASSGSSQFTLSLCPRNMVG
jgi:hypothetical protein